MLREYLRARIITTYFLIPEIDALSAKVKLQTDPVRGRFAVASEDIKVGSIIAIEKPTIYLLNPDDPSLILEFCHHCLRPSPITFVPCQGCTSVIFCSKKCRETSLIKTHRYECELDLYGLRSKSDASSFRIFLALRAVLQYPIEELEKSNLLKMEAHNQTQLFEEELKILSLTILILVLLRNTSYYQEESLKDDIRTLNMTQRELKLAEVIGHLSRVQNFNSHPILTSITEELSSNKQDFNVGLGRLGDCINVAIGSNFNHSCNPNTLRINSVSPPRTFLIASRNIPQGKYRQNPIK